MLFVFAIICDIFMVLALILTLLALFFLYTQIVDVPFPGVLLDGLKHLLLPFVKGIREITGVHFSVFNGHKVEVAYEILAVIAIGLFCAMLVLSSWLNRVDHRIKTLYRQMRHKMFMAKSAFAESQVQRTSLGNVYEPELEAILVASFENMDRYPQLNAEIERILETLDATQKLFNQDGRMLLKFNTTMEAFDFILMFTERYRKASKVVRINFEFKPVFRMAAHAITVRDGLYKDEAFLWQLLSCVGDNQIYLSPSSKEQFDMQNRMTPAQCPFEIIMLGTFSKLGQRTFPNVYRLKLRSGENNLLA